MCLLCGRNWICQAIQSVQWLARAVSFRSQASPCPVSGMQCGNDTVFAGDPCVHPVHALSPCSFNARFTSKSSLLPHLLQIIYFFHISPTKNQHPFRSAPTRANFVISPSSPITFGAEDYRNAKAANCSQNQLLLFTVVRPPNVSIRSPPSK